MNERLNDRYLLPPRGGTFDPAGLLGRGTFGRGTFGRGFRARDTLVAHLFAFTLPR